MITIVVITVKYVGSMLNLHFLQLFYEINHELKVESTFLLK